MLDRARGLVVAEEPMAKTPVAPLPTWQYWGTGVESAPAIVQICMGSVRRHSQGVINVLDDSSISDFVELPGFVMDKREKIGLTHFSEVLRVALLAEHGGTWMDSTVLMTGNTPEVITNSEGFFAFTRAEDPYLLSSWYLWSLPGNPLAVAMRDLLIELWRAESKLVHYFQFHFLFEAAIVLHQELRAMWERSPFLDSLKAHELQYYQLDPFDESRFADICRRNPINKMTWKIDQVPHGSFLAYILANPDLPLSVLEERSKPPV